MVVAGKISAINKLCPPKEAAKKSLTEQILEGFDVEKGNIPEQKKELLNAALKAKNKKLEELEKLEKIECNSSDILMKKQMLYEELLTYLKKIGSIRKSENSGDSD